MDFAFRNSTSEQAEADILSTFEVIRSTLAALEEDVTALEPAWVATEADNYYQLARRFRTGASDVAAILETIEATLKNSRELITMFRVDVGSALRT